ncbi:ATP-dependent DNA helicase PcrA [Thermoclostridium stercorarium subsp. stercorarium DSM 8532]|uniref:ATP-dependent DNA helicase n=2 Tax=Thermoclostridium stercorarium TaxID=1510 RepID=L7VS37_THES1|nr:DNA helicase PcrA [Thermoclostridium stercorarium]AGC69464.1 ATP-dependent DNA helicase PcrA [Thermoclostridium stercorarium subsp. stercorarium DSM 8532]AGI40421.1 PcrA [Thermoclostridium stercorarium subsp. stercorarium DSM 8532]ANW99708.1 ATP-dependent DNA helicase PcrA [Thermoclostridium stercorarium subsp. thermolacticum DSM 2910]
MNLIQGLNPQQKEAVLHTEGPLLVLAGAGSGKTRVLTHRIAYLIEEKGVSPYNILAITFTNKAAGEMKERLEKLIGTKALDVWAGTFHSCCVRILRREIERIGFGRNFVIYDTSDQETLMKDCISQLQYNEKLFPPKMVLAEIGRAKDELIDPEKYAIMAGSDFRLSKIARLYELYQKKLKANNALDFDDIIMYTLKIFDDFPEVLEYYQNKFKYILVDEYQDTNTAQYVLVSMLAQKHRNVCVVGDDDQSIYGWRGANIRNILEFEKDFKGCRVIKLEQNYRSTANILNAANNVIKNNFGRKPKTLWTENGEGDKVRVYEALDEKEEAYFVANQIKSEVRKGRRSYRDFAVLYRINAQSRVFEDAFMKNGVPYKIIGGHKFYDRKEIKDIIAYLKVIQNPHDDISLKRIINVPKRGIGKATIDKAEQLAITHGVSIYSVIVQPENFPELARAAEKLKSFTDTLARFRTMLSYMDLVEWIRMLVEESGIIRELEAEGTEEAKSRIENIREFQSVAVEFVNNSEETNPTVEDFLAQISLVSDVDDLNEEDDRVVLMTMHSAKGLEFPVVFLTGMEEGLFPGMRSFGSESEMEEERRLCYVGITRAKENLYLTYAKTRMLFGNTTYTRPSRFIDEIPPELLDYAENRPFNDGISVLNNRLIGAETWKQRTASFSQAQETDPCDIEVGARVIHKKFGEGTVIKKEREGSDYKLEIIFDEYGLKRMMASFAKLKLL